MILIHILPELGVCHEKKSTLGLGEMRYRSAGVLSDSQRLPEEKMGLLKLDEKISTARYEKVPEV